jgi:hypothetical protein
VADGSGLPLFPVKCESPAFGRALFFSFYFYFIELEGTKFPVSMGLFFGVKWFGFRWLLVLCCDLGA